MNDRGQSSGSEPLLATAATQVLSGTARYAPGSVVGRDLQCADCGYNLLTQPVAGRCSECGRAVEDSLFVLPQLDNITRAINLASWALIIKIVLSCAELEVVGMIIMVVAAGNLYYKCDLTNMQEFGTKIKWLWITTMASVIGSALKVLGFVGFIAYLLLSSSGAPLNASFLQSLNTSFGHTASTAPDGTKTTTIFHGSFDGKVNVVTDPQGKSAAQIVDDDGQEVAKKTLTVGQAASLQDGRGDTVTVTLAGDGAITVTTPTSASMTIARSGTVSMRTTGFNQGLLLGMLDGLLQMVGMVASILYIMICQALAKRARELKLARQFHTILMLSLVGSISLLLPLAGMRTMISGGMGWIILFGVVAGAAGICLLVAAIWLIVASFKLTKALRYTPRQWSDIVVLPGAAPFAVAATPPPIPPADTP